VTDFARGDEIVTEAQALFASLGDALGEGRALRRRGAIANATDDLPRARALLEASLARLVEAGAEAEIGTTLLHLGSLLADIGIADAARPALERSLAIADKTGDPLAKGHVLAALHLADWKSGDLEGAMQTGNEALLIFRELGHSPTEGTVAYRLAAVARGLNRPRAARRYAQLAIDAGERSNTRTTVALGRLNFVRLDLDTDDFTSAASNLEKALDLIDPDADRWVLVDALEATARLLVALDRTGSSPLLVSAVAIRAAIPLPVPPTEAEDLARTQARALQLDGRSGAPALDPGGALSLAIASVRDVPRRAPVRMHRAKG
jgi:tetratricopeptide (TPR) repeat protein